ncbi:inositol polyphosphate 5-phosphatase OCRL-1-like [Dendronephthya gigantea]|uniref:inositol polyphosphate 5-phosphatase OCRL-1-like n=1 Tax=Dendronephthya gigantea TaxID=151771 RepID=UPI00106C9F55|nr:inositol polyphosphate 5-phosphatase OCRL-1-like [Dendronephthya gigantea]
MDDLGEVKAFIRPEEKCNHCIKGNIVRNLEKDKRLLAIIKNSWTASLIIFSYVGETPLALNLRVEFAIPINTEFSIAVERDGDMVQAYGKKVSVRIIAEKGVRLVVEFASGEEVGIFIMELKKAISAYKQRASVVGEYSFKWIENYTSVMFRPRNTTSTDGPSFLSHLSYDNPSCNTSAKDSNPPDEDTDTLGLLGSTVLSSNEIVHRSRPERSSFTSSSLLPDVPLNFRTERETFVQLLLGEREAEFIDIQQMRFLVCSWNVNGQEPYGNLKPWFTTEEEAPDVIAVGFQELDLSTEAFMGRYSKREDEWLEKVGKSVNGVGNYEKVQSVRLVGMLLVVFIKAEYYNYIQEVDTRDVGTGIMGMMGNKGGVAVRFRLFNTTVCFVNSHLAAHQEEVERRNQDYRDIMARLTFPRNSLSITDHDVVFWFGDLNYRIDLPNEDVRKSIDEVEYEYLLEHDQLIKQMRNEKCFQMFKEGWIRFQPTYKYNPGTDNWDSEKDRIPAWCDRVLWWTSGNNSVQQMAYTSCHQLKLSDHKPVHALFNVNVKVVDKKREKVVLEEVVRELDKRENDFLPQVDLSIKEMHFGNIQFLEEKTQTFEIRNVGQLAVQYTFIPKLQEGHFCKPWLRIDPYTGLVKQNGTKTVKVTAFVSPSSAGPLTAKKEKMEDILVLHLQGGKDIFIPISATYIPSVFGSSIESLVFLYRPIQDPPVAKLIDVDCSELDAKPRNSKALDLPKELWLLVDHLQKRGLREQGIFRQSALKDEFEKIRDHLDTKADGNLPGNIHSVAEALLLFLESLEEPVIPFKIYQKCLDCSSNYTLCKQMVMTLPLSHQNVFRYLIEFMKELLSNSIYNGLEPKILATIFSTIMLRPPPNTEPSTGKQLTKQAQSQKRTKFILHFISVPNNPAIGRDQYLT